MLPGMVPKQATTNKQKTNEQTNKQKKQKQNKYRWVEKPSLAPEPEVPVNCRAVLEMKGGEWERNE